MNTIPDNVKKLFEEPSGYLKFVRVAEELESCCSIYRFFPVEVDHDSRVFSGEIAISAGFIKYADYGDKKIICVPLDEKSNTLNLYPLSEDEEKIASLLGFVSRKEFLNERDLK